MYHEALLAEVMTLHEPRLHAVCHEIVVNRPLVSEFGPGRDPQNPDTHPFQSTSAKKLTCITKCPTNAPLFGYNGSRDWQPCFAGNCT